MPLDALKPSELADALRTCFLSGRQIMVHGDPGIGKSQITRQVADQMFAEAYGYKVVDGHLCVINRKPLPPGKAAGSKWVPVPHGFKRPWFCEVRAAQIMDVDLRGIPGSNGNGKSTWLIPDW